MARKIVSFLISFCFIFEQAGFAAPGSFDISSRLAVSQPAGSPAVPEPVRLRSVRYDPVADYVKFFPDDPGGKNESLLDYFRTGLVIPDKCFFVNLRPDAADRMIDPLLAKTDAGRIMLEADLQLKKDTAGYTSPATPAGKEYWEKMYKKAEEIFGTPDVTIPTLTRPWIVPGEILLRETRGSVRIYKARLKVMLESDYLKDSPVYKFSDQRQKKLNEYSSSLIRELIIPRLTREINGSAKYAALRQVFYSLILAQWYKKRFRGTPGKYPSMIDSALMAGLESAVSWSPEGYFKAYQKSFTDGEYNLKENVRTSSGESRRSYFSGGITPICPIPAEPPARGKIAVIGETTVIGGDEAKPLEEEPGAAPVPVAALRQAMEKLARLGQLAGAWLFVDIDDTLFYQAWNYSAQNFVPMLTRLAREGRAAGGEEAVSAAILERWKRMEDARREAGVLRVVDGVNELFRFAKDNGMRLRIITNRPETMRAKTTEVMAGLPIDLGLVEGGVQGIIFNGYGNGKASGVITSINGSHPKKVFLVDNNRANSEAFVKHMAGTGIDATAFWLTEEEQNQESKDDSYEHYLDEFSRLVSAPAVSGKEKTSLALAEIALVSAVLKAVESGTQERQKRLGELRQLTSTAEFTRFAEINGMTPGDYLRKTYLTDYLDDLEMSLKEKKGNDGGGIMDRTMGFLSIFGKIGPSFFEWSKNRFQDDVEEIILKKEEFADLTFAEPYISVVSLPNGDQTTAREPGVRSLIVRLARGAYDSVITYFDEEYLRQNNLQRPADFSGGSMRVACRWTIKHGRRALEIRIENNGAGSAAAPMERKRFLHRQGKDLYFDWQGVDEKVIFGDAHNGTAGLLNEVWKRAGVEGKEYFRRDYRPDGMHLILWLPEACFSKTDDGTSRDYADAEASVVIQTLYEKAAKLNTYTIYPVSSDRGQAYIMGDHGFAFAAWMLALLDKRIGMGATLVHCDAHSDMFDGGPVFDLPRTAEDLRKFHYNINQFIAPACAMGLVNEIYWVKPDYKLNNGDQEYFSAIMVMKDGSRKAYFNWKAPDARDNPAVERYEGIRTVVVHEVTIDDLPDLKSKGPAILDIDEDYFANRGASGEASREFVKDISDEVSEAAEKLAEKIDAGVVTMALSPGFTVPRHMLTIAQRCMAILFGKDLQAGKEFVLGKPWEGPGNDGGSYAEQLKAMLANRFQRPDTGTLFRMVRNGLTEEEVKAACREAGFDQTLVSTELTRLELDNVRPYLYELLRTLFTDYADPTILMAGRDTELLYDAYVAAAQLSAPQRTNVMLFPGSTDFWLNFRSENAGKRLSFFAQYGITEDSLASPSRWLIVDTGFYGSIGLRVHQQLSELFDIRQEKLKKRIMPIKVISRCEQSYAGLLTYLPSLEPEGPGIEQSLADFFSDKTFEKDSALKAAFPLSSKTWSMYGRAKGDGSANYPVAVVMQTLPKFHGPYDSVAEVDGRLYAMPKAWEAVDRDVEQRHFHNQDVVNPGFALLIQYWLCAGVLADFNSGKLQEAVGTEWFPGKGPDGGLPGAGQQSTREEAPGAGQRPEPGGIDFRALPFKDCSVDPVALFNGVPASVGSMDIDAEWHSIESMVNRGILPSCRRVTEFAAACYAKGALANRSESLLECLSSILRMEEERDQPTESALRDILVLLEAA